MAYWIWFPHDFSIDLRGRVEMRRQEHGMTCPSIWRMDAPSRAVAFRRAYTLDAPGRARLFSQGEAYVCIDGASIPDRASFAGAQYDILAEAVRRSLDMAAICRAMEEYDGN